MWFEIWYEQSMRIKVKVRRLETLGEEMGMQKSHVLTSTRQISIDKTKTRVLTPLHAPRGRCHTSQHGGRLGAALHTGESACRLRA